MNNVKSITRILLALLLGITFLAVDRGSASACTCIAGAPLIDYLTAADTIFTGIVTKSDSQRTTFKVIQLWKGRLQPTITLQGGFSTCDYGFATDQDYLVFANKFQGQLTTSICSGTQLLSTADKTISFLNQIYGLLPFAQVQSPATITETGVGSASLGADRIEVRFVLQKPQPDEAKRETESQQLAEQMMANGATQEMRSAWGFYHDGTAIRFVADHEQFPRYDPAAFLQILSDTQAALTNDKQLPIRKVEVNFSLQDCTTLMTNTQTRAIRDAQMRADLLAALIGGRLGGVIAITDNSAVKTIPPRAFSNCSMIPRGPWHELPIKNDLYETMDIVLHTELQVTFAVEEAKEIVEQATQAAQRPLTAAPPTPTPISSSPLTTP